MSTFVNSEKESKEDLKITYKDYQDECMLPSIQKLVAKDLSEPYSIFTYRYFLHQWPQLCICVYDETMKKDKNEDDNEDDNDDDMIGTIVCKAEYEDNCYRGYIAMLAVVDKYRGHRIGSTLVKMGLQRMVKEGCTEIVLETEVSNLAALGLYDKLGFVREERLARYYLNGGDAFRLKLYIDKE